MLNFDGIIEYKNYAEIDLGALKENYRTLVSRARRASGRNTRVICVVKADAYGHGVCRCVPALTSVGADFFAVSSIDEALEVRALAPNADILVLGYTPPKNAPLLARYNIIQCVHRVDYAASLAKTLEDEATVSCDTDAPDVVRVHIKIDTGMNRLGFSARECDLEKTVDEILEVSRMHGLLTEGVFTHFACADIPESEMTDAQNASFSRLVARLRDAGLCLMTHASNSAAALSRGDFGYDALRAGIILYGLPPSDGFDTVDFTPVMRLYSRICEIHTVRRGESVSYGATYVAPRDVRVATLSIGYADGLVRACSGGEVTVRGTNHKIIGRICMDQCMILLDETCDACEGDLVTVYGEDGKNLARFAEISGTINYELICLVGHRVPRVYTEDGVKLYYRSKKLTDI